METARSTQFSLPSRSRARISCIHRSAAGWKLRLARRSTAAILVVLCLTIAGSAQTAGTGAIAGNVMDPSKALVPGASITAVNQATGETRTVTTSASGTYLVPLLPPGNYKLTAAKDGFKQATYNDVPVNVTETRRLDVELQVGAASESVSVEEHGEALETQSSALGNVTPSKQVESLPLVTRNFTQIIALSPGVASEVNNAGSLGRGSGGEINGVGGGTPVSNGTTNHDNNFQMNGMEVNDVQGSGFFGGGVPIPNPDAIQEFKVQTGQYDAAYGRNAGANVDVVTKSGTNQIHGSAFEYLRNEDLNANDYFRKQTKQPRPILRQNQYGFAVGGPAIKDKIFWFGSYQGTKQKNGVASGCAISFKTPAFTNDRSRAALGALFAGQKTALGTNRTVAADGSNISGPALALLQMKLPNGQYLIPTPQLVDSSQPFATRGVSTFSDPCPFDENQFLVNGDYQQSSRSKFSVRTFWDNSDQSQTLPTTNLGGPAAPGFPLITHQEFRVVSLSHSFVFTPSLVNQFSVAYHRQASFTNQKEVFNYSDIGVTAPPFDNVQPEIAINGGLTLGGNGQSVNLVQNHYDLQDTLFWTKGRHSITLGGGLIRSDNDLVDFKFLGGMFFLGFPDFLIGQAGDVFLSIDLAGQTRREWRAWDGDMFIQDNFKMTRRLTLNLGFRYERDGQFTDRLGRNTGFDPALAAATPPAGGTLAGYTVPSNYTGPLPAGVTKTSNNLGIKGIGQNTWNPRVGFAWQVPGGERAVLRGGYGIYHSRTTDQPLLQLLTVPPFSVVRQNQFPANASATISNPFPPAPTLPQFIPYSPTTALGGFATYAPDFRPPVTQEYSLGLQTELLRDLVFEVGYAGARGQHLLRTLNYNQAQLASPSNPIRGVTTNTRANIQQRVPIQGFASNGLLQIQTEAASEYNSLQSSLRKRFSHGLQFLASYTWARDLTTNNATTTGGNGGTSVGNQLIPHWGPDGFIRPHRFVVSYVYDLPGPQDKYSALGRALAGWEFSGVTVFQAGQRLSVTQTNTNNIYGLTSDYAQLSSTPCANYGTSGKVQDRLKNYINTSCFAPAASFGSAADPAATDFGNAPVGLLHGPDQRNWDIALLKRTPFRWPTESTNLEFRAEFFNALNTPQFSNPQLSRSSATFGQITSLAVAPRIIQFALKLNF